MLLLLLLLLLLLVTMDTEFVVVWVSQRVFGPVVHQSQILRVAVFGKIIKMMILTQHVRVALLLLLLLLLLLFFVELLLLLLLYHKM